jgi:hypothetical protein
MELQNDFEEPAGDEFAEPQAIHILSATRQENNLRPSANAVKK